ncbi:MAG: glycosyltransferase [Sulfurovum sp.]|nr:glycosyltransferase [Sulfurovum sp.]
MKAYENITILPYHYPFNYASINNFAVQYSQGEIIALVNNDTEIITAHWLSEMVQHALRPDIGAVGAMLYYPNDTVQHGGVILGIGGVANHSHKYMHRGASGYFSRLLTVQNYSAVTGACLVVEKSLYKQVAGLNEQDLTVAFNDIDFCLKLLEEGKRNLWTPYVELYHHESVSRGKEETPSEKKRFAQEVRYMRDKWEFRLKEDKYYNINLSKEHIDFRLNSEIFASRESEDESHTNKENFEAIKKKHKLRGKFKQRKKVLAKFKRIPHRFVQVFNQEQYIDANIDIKEGIAQGQFLSGLEHFILYGYDEVREGKRRIGTRFPSFTEQEYADDNPIIVIEVDEGKFSSIFEHFLQFGYQEYLLGTRELVGEYPFTWTEALLAYVKSYFDESAYLSMNIDVVEAIKLQQFKHGWEHFILQGATEVRRGERHLHPLIPKQSDRDYARIHTDIFDEMKYTQVYSPFEHFLRYGAEEMIAGERKGDTIGLYRYTQPKLFEDTRNDIKNFAYQPLISIIMPVYNVEVQWLELAITSVLNQWYPRWELCISDDASTNQETIAYLQSLDHPHIHIRYLSTNGNISIASNDALTQASGEYIALMDHDDTLSPDALYEMLKYSIVRRLILSIAMKIN